MFEPTNEPMSEHHTTKDDKNYHCTHHTTGQNGLEVSRPISQNDKNDIFLGSQTMDPSVNPYSPSSVGSGIPDLRLQAK